MAHPASGTTADPVTRAAAAVRATSTVPGCERSVPRARAFVDAVLGPGHRGAEVARLLVSELVTNAVQHSDSRHPGGSISVLIAEVPGGIQVEVADAGSQRSVPVVKDDPLATHGRGLFLVQSLADDWGYRCEDGRTTVWFRLAGLPTLTGRVVSGTCGRRRNGAAARGPGRARGCAATPAPGCR